MALVVHDTLRRAKVAFEPAEEGRVSMYVCGPTVQADAHVGHGRYAVVFDVLRRWLLHSGYAVVYASNITDVDDKIILRANRERTSPSVVATRYSQAWNRTMDALGVLPPDVQPFATGHIGEMQALVQRLVDADHAYVKGGNVLFRVRSFEGYGKLSGRRVDDMQQGDDIVDADQKEDPLDFAMWKAAKPGEPSWPSPWGDGRPGWHIECSAMATKHLGHGFDIHGGGLDLVFPHHENEVAQSEAARGLPLARIWMHNGMVRIAEEKMSKSVGNIFQLSEAVERYGAPALVAYLISGHYRQPLEFTDAALSEAQARVERIRNFLRGARVDGSDPAADAATEEFAAALCDDFNTPRALAAMFGLIAEANRREVPGAHSALLEMLPLLGLEALAEAEAEAGEEALALLRERTEAREDRDFERADRARDRLRELGYEVRDTPEGAQLVPMEP